MRWKFWKKKDYSCYFLVLHFASAEDAARFGNEHLDIRSLDIRMLRGGETIPMCRREL